MDETDRSRLDSLLELLTDEVERRLHARVSAEPQKVAEFGDGPAPQSIPLAVMPGARFGEEPAAKAPLPTDPCPDELSSVIALDGPVEESPISGLPDEAVIAVPEIAPAVPAYADEVPDAEVADSATVNETYHPLLAATDVPAQTIRFLSRLAIGLLVVIVLINIPFNRHGTALARAIPGSASLVIRNGLLVKEIGKPDVYMFQNDTFRWISSLDAFDHYGYRWQDVHEVEAGWLDRFEMGAPIHVLVKCESSPHIYRLEGGLRRWIVDIPTFEAEGHKWDDVVMRSCAYIRSIPMGETIPPGHGPAPEP